ncbi:MAG TPA: hypothetical protein VHY33_04670, partial [Thermoanaerobaculia bacterium]|jgi:hypothetical protein|nr:hypothetical protein [Thermoanaerobaculia bacterium]
MTANAAGLSIQIGSDNESVTLTISGPNDFRYSHQFASARSISLKLRDIGATLPDGSYTYEMRLAPRVSDGVRAQIAAARESGDDAALARIRNDAGLKEMPAQSGAFTIMNGSLVSSDATEPSAGPSEPNTKVGLSNNSGGTASTQSVHNTPKALDVVTADDIIVQGSACIGLDCVNNESFGFDTIRLKENNTRIKFDDTSTSTGFPNHDWQLTANDSASGGANKFSIEDITAATVPMTITGSAPTNSIFVDSTGRLGLRTATPVLDIHVATSNTPAMRLEQSNAGGFTAQTWDVAGNEANFFVRDVTGGSKLPFRIRPAAPTSSIDISASGNVGIGTASPSERLHALNTADSQTVSMVENANASANAAAILRAKSDTAQIQVTAQSSARSLTRFGQNMAGWNEIIQFSGNGLAIGTTSAVPLIFGTNNANRLQIDSAGAVTVSGNFTVTGVKNFAMPDPADAKKAIYYASLEGPEAGTYYRGTARTVSGEAIVELPGYFSRITEKERMTVQITPVGAPTQLYIAEKTPERVVIKVASGSTDVEFDYFVQGVRKGYLDFRVERDNNLPKN